MQREEKRRDGKRGGVKKDEQMRREDIKRNETRKRQEVR